MNVNVKNRAAKITRKTNETQIELELNIDGTGKYSIDMPIGFLKHMLELFAKHGLFDLQIKCSGDIEIDFHHTV
ncbi:MAG TPA: imidazoleglycerol-phosphate dehydratase, partial [bacterium]|nr:imidazoleglycerol-phosphate dehydratase [bacterium]